MTTVLDQELEVRHDLGVTRCHVLARELRTGAGRVVRVSELTTNPGPSITLVFDQVAEAIRRLLPAGPEPVWIEHWPARALASALLHHATIHTNHLLTHTSEGWRREPIDASTAHRLLRP